ncbi:allophanate hydrolase [Halioxenophilus sp. WMMB6]|uniref:allophanate hydrolase n=1 Tax=Halioxenophilus sp. WMMB6 TaxID=3073815 RepID=UPI00295EBBBC|nr:allophanate hydrolase [Halioxenophilus sp. WMMB6]
MQTMTVSALRQAYSEGSLSPDTLMAEIRQRAAEFSDRNIFIHLLSAEEQAPYLAALADKAIASHPLWGIPFVIKDNIDLAGITTTAACPEFAYTPGESAFVVQQLLDAGAIPVGKGNLDQLATGLNGTRSPYGECHNSFDPDYISGGSSSGSAVSVALGLASFSLGTDTAGSGRVPACFNNLVGVKPSRGLLSNRGMLPACQTLDCISIFALTLDDANQVLAVAEGFDSEDGYSRKNPFHNSARSFGMRSGPLKLGVIPADQLKFFGSDSYAQAYQKSLDEIAQAGIELVELDYAPFNEAALLLYEGPWVSERYLAALPLVQEKPEALLPVIRTIIEPGGSKLATDLFSAQYRLQSLRQACYAQLEQVDALLTPTAGRHYTVAELLAEPILYNSNLGYYTNYVNLLDMAGLAIPTQFTSEGMPFGLTLIGPAFSDRALMAIGNRIQQACPLDSVGKGMPAPAAATNPVAAPNTIDVAVCGAHLDGLPLNWQLKERGASLVAAVDSAPCYRFYALAGGPPYRPGMIRDEANGRAIAMEVWRVPAAEFGSFVAGIPAPLGIGKVELADGRWVSGFICEPCGVDGAEEITQFGGWRTYLASKG